VEIYIPKVSTMQDFQMERHLMLVLA